MKKIIMRNSAVELFFIGIIAVAGLIKTRLITGMLGIEYYGLFSLFNPLFQLLVIVDAGMGTAFLMGMYEPMAKGQYGKVASLTNGLMETFKGIAKKKLIIGLVMALTLPLIISDSSFTNMYILIVYILFLIGNVLGTFYYSPIQVFESNRDNHLASLWTNAFLLVQMSLEIFILYVFTKVLVINSAIVMILIVMVGIFIRKPKQEIIKRKIQNKYSEINLNQKELDTTPQQHTSALTVHAIAGTMHTMVKPVIISSYLGLISVGIYGLYNVFINLANQLYRAISNGTASTLHSHIASTPDEQHFGTYFKINTLITGVVLFLSVGLALFIEPAIKILLGQNVSMLGLPFIIGLSFLTRTMRAKLHDVEYAKQMFEETKLRAVIESVIVLLLSVIFITRYDIAGVFLAALVGNIFVCIVDPIIVSRKYYGYKFALYNYANYVCAIVVYTLLVQLGTTIIF